MMALNLSSSAGLASLSSPQRLVGLKAGTFLRQRVHNLHVHKIHKQMCRAVLGSNASENAIESKGKDFDLPPPGCSRFKVELSRPLGLVLEEDKAGKIFVAEIVKDGNADKSGLVDIGDQLIATSAITYGNVEDYQGVKVRKGMQTVRLNVRGERFETVMAAIGTHPGHIKDPIGMKTSLEDIIIIFLLPLETKKMDIQVCEHSLADQADTYNSRGLCISFSFVLIILLLRRLKNIHSKISKMV
ncbi:uncharacterized protein LOC131044522 isoform X2 [Cryptomeria japonica]|uniref:uncharacterized protein LOC131044522 isoform X2 n=1 Tax=Cryptomeria japonica TaxID=3369 RepID=UPI0027DA09FC|nr:uncharacterized protein LOC131044522 isoform X2 [Cryptomeria japonica]